MADKKNVYNVQYGTTVTQRRLTDDQARKLNETEGVTVVGAPVKKTAATTK